MAHSEALWLDSDVILDWLMKRQPWFPSIDSLIRRSINGDWELWISPLTLANVYYIHRKQDGSVKAQRAIWGLTQLANVATLDCTHVASALSAGRTDFEDELQIASASSIPGLSAIITRNLSDYSHSHLPSMTADTWIQQHPAT